MENVENNYNEEVVEEKKEEEVIVPIEVLKVKITEERKKEINKEIALLTEQLQTNRDDLLKFFTELEKVQKKIKIRENNVTYLENKIRALVLESEGLEVKF
jgi:hypothetical protein